MQIKSTTRSGPLDKADKAKMAGIIGDHKHGIAALAAEVMKTSQQQKQGTKSVVKHIKGEVFIERYSVNAAADTNA